MTRFRFQTACAAAAAALFTQSAFAQDECSTALPITTDVLEPFDTTMATQSADLWDCGSQTSNDVWYTFTATADYMADVSTCNMATYDTRIAVYEGGCGTLTSVACNDDGSGCAGFSSFLTFAATSGTQYWVRVGGFSASSMGTGDLLVTGPPPPPDECMTAAPVTPGVAEPFDTTVATPSMEPWACTGSTPKDVWYTFTATADYMAEASTCDIANFDTRIEVFDGMCGALNSIDCNDDGPGCSGFTSIASFMAVSGTQYWIRIGGFGSASEGQGDLLVTAPPTAVVNDECGTALELFNGVTEMFDNTMATNSDPMSEAWVCGGTSTNALDIWYQFTVPADGSVTVDTFGSALDTRLSIYEGGCGALSLIDCNDDAGGLQSSITFAGACGTTYIARIAGFSSASGTGQVTATFNDMQPNDDCANATVVGLGMTNYCNVNATDSLVDMGCVFNGEVSDVWFSFTSPSTCPITVDLSGSNYDTGMAVYSGDCMMLTQIGCDDDGGTGLDSLVTFNATAGETYLLQIGGFNGANGDGVMNITEGTGIGTLLCAGEFNSTGVGADLKLTGSDVAADNDLTIAVNNLPMNSMGYVVHSMETNLVMNPGGSQGNLCIASFNMGRFAGDVLDSGTTGSASFSPDLTQLPIASGSEPVLAGETRYFQHWYRDNVGGMATSNFSSAIGITFN